jgi:hypothetical protein
MHNFDSYLYELARVRIGFSTVLSNVLGIKFYWSAVLGNLLLSTGTINNGMVFYGAVIIYDEKCYLMVLVDKNEMCFGINATACFIPH